MFERKVRGRRKRSRMRSRLEDAECEMYFGCAMLCSSSLFHTGCSVGVMESGSILPSSYLIVGSRFYAGRYNIFHVGCPGLKLLREWSSQEMISQIGPCLGLRAEKGFH